MKKTLDPAQEALLTRNQGLEQDKIEIQAARQYADAIIETVREPLLVLDSDLRVQRANAAFYRLFQVSEAETHRRLLFELGNGQWNIPSLQALLLEILPTNHWLTDYEVEHVFPRIGRHIMLLNARRIEERQLILLAIEDVTERTRAIQANERLLRQREEFLAITSHELKTPLTSLKGYIQLVQRRARTGGEGEDAATDLLVRMDRQVDKLTHLVSSLLDVTMLQAGKATWHTHWFDLNLLVSDILADLSQTTTRHQLRSEGMIQPQVFGDRDRLGQVLTNLLTNAIKYSPQATPVVVTLSADADKATVGVQDFGTGIVWEQQAQIFERFARGTDAAASAAPGLGLGLYIAAQIVEQQGGHMWVKSQPGDGSTFFFTIPLKPLQAS